jgi:hypothetical protein
MQNLLASKSMCVLLKGCPWFSRMAKRAPCDQRCLLLHRRVARLPAHVHRRPADRPRAAACCVHKEHPHAAQLQRLDEALANRALHGSRVGRVGETPEGREGGVEAGDVPRHVERQLSQTLCCLQSVILD